MADITPQIVETMRQPVLVLDRTRAVVLANRAFCTRFRVSASETVGRQLRDLGNCQWDIPELLAQLDEVADNRTEIRDFRVEHDFPELGRRVMLVNASVTEAPGAGDRILFAIEDVTEREVTRHELDGHKEFAEKIIDASRDALLILDWDLRVRSANQTFYEVFKISPEGTEGCHVYELGDGEWDIPGLRELLDDVLPDNHSLDDFEVTHDFPRIGYRHLLLNARRIDHLQLILLAIEDVTERERSVRALHESEARLTTMLNHAPIGIGVFDREGRWIYKNPHLAPLVGDYLPSHDPELVRHWHAYDQNGEPIPRSEWPGARALRGEIVAPGIDFCANQEAEGRWLRVAAAPIPRKGEVEEAMVILEDVTERRKIADRLRESEARLRQLFDSIDEGFCIIEMVFDEAGRPVDYRFLETNAAFESQTGLTDAVGRTVRSFEPEHEEHWFRVYGEIARSREPRRFELPAEKLGRYYDVCAFPVDEPELARVGVLFKDIAPRIRMEEALRESEARLSEAMKAGRLGVFDYDPRTGRIEWDPTVRSLWGVAEDEEISYETFISAVHDEDVPKVENAVAEAFDPEGDGLYEAEYRVVNRETGEIRWVRADGSATFSDGTPIRLVGTVADITERKRAEQESELLARELSHRVKNTLAVVQSLARMTNGRHRTVKEYREAFLGRLQALARAHSLLLDENWERMDLRDLIELTVRAFEVDSPETTILAGASVDVTAKQAMGLSLVLHELGTNAVKYGSLSEHGGKLRIAWAVEKGEERPLVRLTWVEREGPPVNPPERHGFGTEMIRETCSYELDGEAHLDFAPEGLTCEIVFPLE